MTENNEAPIQYSTKVGEDILLLRANDGEEFKARTEDILKALDETADRWLEIRQLLLGKSVVAGGVVGQPDSQVAPAQFVQPTQSAPPPGPGGQPMCDHGTMKDKLGSVTKAGQPYKFRYYCPQYGSDCQPRN